MVVEGARLFEAMADRYDVLEPWYRHLYASLHAILRAELSAAGPAGARRALDAGCGTGFQAAHLVALGYETHGADLSAGLLAVARRKLPNVAFARANLEVLPYRDGVFDAVTSCGSTLSFVERPARALAELARVLRPGGRLLLEVEHRWSLDLGWALLSSLTGDALGYEISVKAAWRAIVHRTGHDLRAHYPGYPGIRLFTRPEVARILAGVGLVPVRTWGIHAITNLIPSTVLHRPRLPRPVEIVYAALCRLDAALARFPPGRGLANSLVVLARKTG